ncbi:hypothetical protein DTL42_07940 [Bremerella cremea]|uniref:Uncharacterized protein n=1 Tax=Bremerella cremea TaxID=1031537 RepID=A0A368KT54_9BACT|nr:hypothetical protein [Bremerella cremea]RCS52758.1 hypothetical protein DTL42_07940 [Bremerella cremea]
MIRRVALLLFVTLVVVGSSVNVEAGNLFRFRRSSNTHYTRHLAPRTVTPTPGYEYQTSRFEARTTTGYTMLFGM